ncbi:phosphocarrier protein HPr [Alkalispirochaeta americana]|uniref:Phosphocarrier protein HPr n=1 Tax=Alkalispirochaeta americana TaxID=159291 RepID=A0A1N6Q7W0_9SPIO|nr:HPr family phosphocarrier protein [Alkalispirochaeta americana]SIQ12585.1 phosphocarrier protein HPr [Alkalispirochaeta americana]
MIEETVQVVTEEGLHTRPANQFVKLAKGFDSLITITKGEKTATGTSLLKIMKLGVVQGDTVTLAVNGEDEQQAMEAVRALLLGTGQGGEGTMGETS